MYALENRMLPWWKNWAVTDKHLLAFIMLFIIIIDCQVACHLRQFD